MDSYLESEKLRHRCEHRKDYKSISNSHQNLVTATLNRQSHYCMNMYEQDQSSMENSRDKVTPMLESCDQEDSKSLVKENEVKIHSPLGRFKLTNSDEGKNRSK